MSNQKHKKGKYVKKHRRHMPVALVVLCDLLMVGLILVTFAFFHHVLPAMISEYERQQAMLNATEPPVTQAPTEVTEPITESQVPSEVETVGETEPPTEPDNRTPWQIKFEDHFTEEVVITENSYSSPDVSITLETISVGEGNKKITYHIADIYIASIDNFITHTANNEMRYFGTQDILEMDAAANGILSLSGDFLTYQRNGFLMRNREVYVSNNNLYSICVLYGDGTMETYDSKKYEIDEIMEKDPIHVWSFGPPLLDENGKTMKSYNVSTAVSYPNPRSAIGYYEPGHYCFVLVDGRQEGYSKGMTIPELAQVFQDLGCKAAYNLDGGGSAVMVFNHQRFSRQSNGGGRDLGDILVIRDDWFDMQTGEEAVG